MFHGGHEPSFGKAQLNRIVDQYLAGGQVMGNVMDWYRDLCQTRPDIYAAQDWGRVPRG